MKNTSHKKPWLNTLKEYLLITFGILLVTAGVYFFKFPNNFAIGGVTGLSMVLSKALNHFVSAGTLVTIINVILIIIGYFVLGKDFGIKTIYASLVLSFSLNILEITVPMQAPLTNNPLLELAFAVIIPAVGTAILFNIGSSSGGTDIVAMILRKYTSLDIGKSLLVTDFLLTLSGFLVFSIETVLMSILGLVVKTTMVDSIIENLNLNKYFTVITSKPDEICRYITETIKRSATIADGKGAFTKEDRKIIITVMNRSQAVQLRRFIKETDPNAFVFITNTSEIVGKGFRE